MERQPRDPGDIQPPKEKPTLVDYCDDLSELGELMHSETLGDAFAKYIKNIPSRLGTSIWNLETDSSKKECISLLNAHSRMSPDKKGTGVDTADLHDLYKYSAARNQKEWKKVCEEKGAESKSFFADYKYLGTRVFDDNLIVSGIHRSLKSNRYAGMAKERLEKMMPDAATEKTMDFSYHDHLSSLGELIIVDEILDVLTLYKFVAPIKEYKHIKSLGRKLHDQIVFDKDIESGHGLSSSQYRSSQIDATGSYLTSSVQKMPESSTKEKLMSEVSNLHVLYAEILQLRSISAHTLLEKYPEAFPETRKSRDTPLESQDLPNDEEKSQPETVTDDAPGIALNSLKNQRQQEIKTLYDQLSSQLDHVLQTNSSIEAPWNLSKNEIRKRGLAGAHSALVHGVMNEEQEVILPGKSKDSAHQTIAHIEHLGELSVIYGSFDEYKTIYLKTKSAEERDLQKQLQEIITSAEKLPPRMQAEMVPAQHEIFSTRETIEEIQAEWAGIKYLIQEHWPKGRALAKNIENMLFESSSETDSYDRLTELPLAESDEVGKERIKNIAAQLDMVILPPKASISDLENAIRQLDIDETMLDKIDWKRLHNLVEIRDMYDGTLYRSKRGSLGGAPPYFVVEIEFEDDKYAIAESPVEGNATYIVSENLLRSTWLEILSLPKFEVRELGATRIIHATGQSPHYHRDKIEHALIDSMTVLPDAQLQNR